jgi:hypothetical protein
MLQWLAMNRPVLPRPAALLQRDGLTLLMVLGMVYLFASATLPALLEQKELAGRRAATQSEVDALVPRVQRLQGWTEAAEQDPLTQRRLLESWKLSPDAPGYRVLTEAEPPSGNGQKPK